MEPDAATPVYDLTIRAGVLHESASEFLTSKERTCFDFSGSTRTVVIEAGPLEAIVYVLLHEATHMVDGALGLTPVGGRSPAVDADLLTTGVWTDRLTVASAYANPLLDGLVYRRGGRPIPVSDAHRVYGALQRTPFVSLYASSNWHDDVADLVAWRGRMMAWWGRGHPGGGRITGQPLPHFVGVPVTDPSGTGRRNRRRPSRQRA